MKFLVEEVDGAVAANNIKCLLVSEYSIKSALENFNVRSKPVTKVHNIDVDTPTQALDNVVREFRSLESIGIQPIQEEKSTYNPPLCPSLDPAYPHTSPSFRTVVFLTDSEAAILKVYNNSPPECLQNAQCHTSRSYSQWMGPTVTMFS
ncbi:hypothetical protein NPIL_364601 [Nephila pilipes]|uniref:Uncharacterized protein n=1 Tax=Nephila pilipes TaxID=299642 RepID=A0A8X6P3P5_NEPPI|nr:hypothetical protein NPIL_364601 [Nephila pilipes]